MLKKIFFLFLVLLIAGLGAAFYFGRQAAQLPDWYSETRDEEPALDDPIPLDDPLDLRSPAAPASGLPRATRPGGAKGRQPRRLDEPELNRLLRRNLEARAEGRRALEATKAVHAELAGDRLVIGAVTDIATLMAATRNERERRVIRRLTRYLPWLEGRDFYVGVEGLPRVRDGKLAFDEVRVKVGNLSLDPFELADILGLDSERLDRELAVRLSDLDLQDVRIEDGSLVLSPAR